MILTNPPFGATAEHRITPDREPEVLEQFEVAHVWRRSGGHLRPTDNLIVEGVPPEYLFVERAIKWVKPGGKVGIVVPRGLLDNDKALAVRTFITQHTRVLAVVNCHDDTFKPHTDAKAALLVLERKKATIEEDDYPIFMAISQGIGHNGVGQPVYKTNTKGDIVHDDGEPVLDQDTDEIYEAWDLLGRGEASPSEYYYTIPRSQLAASRRALVVRSASIISPNTASPAVTDNANRPSRATDAMSASANCTSSGRRLNPVSSTCSTTRAFSSDTFCSMVVPLLSGIVLNHPIPTRRQASGGGPPPSQHQQHLGQPPRTAREPASVWGGETEPERAQHRSAGPHSMRRMP